MLKLKEVMNQIEAEEQFAFERPFLADVLIATMVAIKTGISKQRIIAILKLFIEQLERQL